MALALLSGWVRAITPASVFDSAVALELAHIAVEEAMRLRASYAEARVEGRWQDFTEVSDGRLTAAAAGSDLGLAVRVLVGGAWGFAAVGEPNRHDVAVAARRAVEQGRAAAVLQEHPVGLAPVDARRGVYRTPVSRDPMAVALEEKAAVLFGIDGILRGRSGIAHAAAHLRFCRRRQVVVSSEGSEFDRDVVAGGLDFRAVAADGTDRQRRSFAGGDGLVLGRGFEHIEALGWEERAAEVADEAVALLAARPCPNGATTVLLSSAEVRRHLVFGLGPCFELDRILGGGSVLEVGDLGVRRFGGEAVSLYSDPSVEGGAGTSPYDEEGVPAERFALLEEGRVTGFQSGRETAARVGLQRSHGGARTPVWSEPPRVLASNLVLAPGQGDLDALVADTSSGLFLDGPRAFDVDLAGGTFVASSEVGWLIEGGKRAAMVKNPILRGSLGALWRACDAVAGPEAATLGGNWVGRGRCLGVGASAPLARFVGIDAGAGSPDLVEVGKGGPLPLARTAAPRPARSLPRSLRRVARNDVR